ncbi:MAG: tRNA pseudouridine(38-40) synthase TruA [Planctomycetia bacterium 21-64-5]|nr:MAG: tRNA pseudouridine(38-40) synthase TruA [Planctomycetia bacterium 21-64-5]
MRTIKLTLAYDGTAYAGWQVQPGQRTLQETLEAALATITGETIRVTASGRTDAGVHALGQVVSFDTQLTLSAEVFQRALNAELPDDMAVLDAAEAPPGFHAIRDAVRKRYRYVLHDGPVPDVFRRHYAWHYRQRLDAEVMHRAAQGLLGTHDFRSFETGWPQRTSSVRTIFDLSVRRSLAGDEELIAVEVEADGFLYNMVRAIVGTLVEVGRGSRPEGWPAEVLAAQDRRVAGMTAPPQGLFLLRVEYT